MLSALLAWTLVAAPAASAPAASPAWERAVAAAREAVARGQLDARSKTPLAERARAAGLDASAIVRLLTDLVDACPADTCPGLAREDATAPLIRALAELGGPADAPILVRLAARHQYNAELALEQLLLRAMSEAVPKARCAPPTAAELAAARADLGDYAVIRLRDGRLRGEAPTAAELDDLAYFYASVAAAGPEVGAAVEARAGSPLKPGTADPERERLVAAMTAAESAGDLAGVARHGLAYLERLGYPGALDGSAEDTWAWGGARYSYVFRDLARAGELLGDHALADHLYRRADPGGGACGTSTSYRWEIQVRGAIRSAEHLGDCRLALPERLLDIDGARWSAPPVLEDYGPARLAAAGFDLPRLLRGAVLTAGRDREPAELRAALERAPAPLRTAALARLARRGPEAWERRVHAIEGLADIAGRAAIPVLSAMLPTSPPTERRRLLAALGALAERPIADPCDPDDHGFSGRGSSQWERPIGALGDRCDTSLRLPEAGRLALSLAPWLDDPDPETRQAAAEALGRIGHRAALPALRARRSDPYSPDDRRRCDDDDRCRRYFPVRDAVAEAIQTIRERSASDPAWRRHDPAPTAR